MREDDPIGMGPVEVAAEPVSRLPALAFLLESLIPLKRVMVIGKR